MLLIKNDPNYHEQWPRRAGAVQAHSRHRRTEEPHPAGERRQALEALAGRNAVRPRGDVQLLQARVIRMAWVKPGTVTATFAGEKDPTGYKGSIRHSTGPCKALTPGCTRTPDIHAVRIVLLELHEPGESNARAYDNHARASECEFLRGSVPQVRRRQVTDRPRRQPDTSFLAKIPADVAWTFQTLDDAAAWY